MAEASAGEAILVRNPALLGMLTLGNNPVIDGSSTTGTIDWTFDSNTGD